MLRCHSVYVIITSIDIWIASFASSIYFYWIIWKNIIFVELIWFYNLTDCTPLSCRYFFSFQMCEYFQYQCSLFFICLCIPFFLRNISTFLLALASAVMDSSAISSSVTSRLSVFESFFMLESVQLPYPQSSAFFQRSHWYLIFLGLNVQPNETIYNSYLCNYFWIDWVSFFLLILIIVLTNSSLC